MQKTILTANQTKILDAVGQNNEICRYFYLTGGTALAEYYLRHRLSEDLDFFAESEFDVSGINAFFAGIRKNLNIESIDYQQSFNRNLFFLKMGKETIKTEFTFFPFARIEKKIKRGNLFIDSVVDIATNKLFTIYQNPRSRDFIDLYCINKKYGFSIGDLVKKAKIKFDFHIDFLQLGAQFFRATDLKDYPNMKIDLGNYVWQSYFLDEAKRFSQKILD